MKKSLLILFTLLANLLLFANPVTAQTDASELKHYRLGSGDSIKINVYGQSDLTIETRLPDTGNINYPFLGDIRAVGLTTAQLEQVIYQGLKGDYLVSPSVSVTISQYRPFFIDGEVKKPGGYPYQPGLSIDKAAALAGGYTQRAAKDKIIILRDISGAQQEVVANTSDTVLPGDIVRIQQSFF